MRRVYLEIYRLAVYAFITSCDPGRFIFNLPLHLRKIVELAAHHVVKFCPFALSCHARRSVWNINLIIFWSVVAFAWDIDEL